MAVPAILGHKVSGAVKAEKVRLALTCVKKPRLVIQFRQTSIVAAAAVEISTGRSLEEFRRTVTRLLSFNESSGNIGPTESLGLPACR